MENDMNNNDVYELARKLADRSYTVYTHSDETTDGNLIYVATNPELEGCMSQGATVEEAVKNLFDARIDYIASLLEDNLPVPEPQIISTNKTSASTALNVSVEHIKVINQKFSIEYPEEVEKTDKDYSYAISYGD